MLSENSSSYSLVSIDGDYDQDHGPDHDQDEESKFRTTLKDVSSPSCSSSPLLTDEQPKTDPGSPPFLSLSTSLSPAEVLEVNANDDMVSSHLTSKSLDSFYLVLGTCPNMSIISFQKNDPQVIEMGGGRGVTLFIKEATKDGITVVIESPSLQEQSKPLLQERYREILSLKKRAEHFSEIRQDKLRCLDAKDGHVSLHDIGTQHSLTFYFFFFIFFWFEFHLVWHRP